MSRENSGANSSCDSQVNNAQKKGSHEHSPELQQVRWTQKTTQSKSVKVTLLTVLRSQPTGQCQCLLLKWWSTRVRAVLQRFAAVSILRTSQVSCLLTSPTSKTILILLLLLPSNISTLLLQILRKVQLY